MFPRDCFSLSAQTEYFVLRRFQFVLSLFFDIQIRLIATVEVSAVIVDVARREISLGNVQVQVKVQLILAILKRTKFKFNIYLAIKKLTKKSGNSSHLQQIRRQICTHNKYHHKYHISVCS